MKYDLGDGQILSGGVVVDSISGATPFGAVPSSSPQTFLRPISTVTNGLSTGSSTTQTMTSASGNSTVITVPAPPGSPVATTVVSSTTVGANKFPLDQGFSDTPVAGNLGFTQPITDRLKLALGATYSDEHDFRAISGNVLLMQDFNSHNTTLSAGVNYESDRSSPIGGVPTPLTVMNAEIKGAARSRDEVNALFGVTQVMNRRWLTALNYSFGKSTGYETDPYKIISVVDSITGVPINQLYENRPGSRQTNSIYWENKVHLTADVVDIRVRYFWDDWNVRSITLEGKYRVQFDGWYLEPQARWYKQDGANFFHFFLTATDPTPEFASADTRLANFDATTVGLKLGLKLDRLSELNLRVGYYWQQGNNHPAGAVGQLQQQDLFPDLQAVSVIVGYSFAF